MARSYYAIAHHYDGRFVDERGMLIGTVHTFGSKSSRDAFVQVDADTPHRREALSMRNPTDRRAIERVAYR